MFYSKSTGGFYTREIHGDNIPADAVEITVEEHQALIEGQSQGKHIVANENGYPVLVDPPAPTPEQLATQARATRDAKLTATNWLVERHREEQETGATTLTAQQYADLLAYRQALRDVPQQAGFPHEIDWPVSP
jgi:hypothetical protein